MRCTYTVLLTLGVSLLAAQAAADPGDQSERARYDYSRFSDGPRRVPTPRGASQRRAQSLGLGTRESASRLLHHAPDPSWLRAASWREREVERLLWPVDDGNYVRGFGFVRHTRPDLRHDGVDVSAPVGTVVRAAADGIVAYSDNGIRGYGNCVILVHPNGWVSLYAHNSRTTVQPGWRVRRGERIALVGSTGISRGPHVHFELRRDGRPIDPLALFDGGPAFVRRVAARAFAAGRVPEPEGPSPDDRRAPPPLPDAPPAAASEAHATPTALGTVALARRLHRFAPSADLLAQASGRIFSNVLWPMRGGALGGRTRSGVLVASDAPQPVRAAADGTVVFAGRLGARGRTVIVLHPMGWVTTYAALDEVHVAVGDEVARGAWIAHARRLRFDLRIDGRRVDPRDRFAQAPD